MSTTLDSPAGLLSSGQPLVSFAAVAAKFGVNAATVWRWASRGQTVSGGRLRMPAVRVGNSWRTTFEAVARWSEQVTAAALPSDNPADATPTPKQRARQVERASRQADAIFGPSA